MEVQPTYCTRGVAPMLPAGAEPTSLLRRESATNLPLYGGAVLYHDTQGEAARMFGPDRYWGVHALEFVDHVESAKRPEEVVALFASVIAECGFHAHVIGGLTTLSSDRLKEVLFADGWPAEWSSIYLRENLVAHDPVPRHGFRVVEPFEWSEAPYDPEAEPLSKAVMDRALDFRLAKGLFVPIHYGDSFSGAVSIGGERPDLGPGVKPALHLMSLYAHNRLRAMLYPVQTSAPILTPREREVLRWTASGKSSWEIGMILSISERTVNAHITSAMKKLNAANRTAAVVNALRRREIDV
jgi:LuxR family quorum sensing-dependent transcriptional regulator